MPLAAGKGDHQPPQDGPEAASAASPAGQSLDPGKATASRQRKLAMEEIVIRDHLGHEVGCMDAIGQSQRSLEKEEELEDPNALEDGCDGWSQPGPVDIVLGPKGALGEGPADREPGSRDGPEGESPTSRNCLNPARPLQSENSGLEGQGDGPLGRGAPAKEAGEKGVGQQAVPEQSAKEMEPALTLAPGDVPTWESTQQSPGSQTETPESQGEGPGHERLGCPPLEQLTPPLPDQLPPGHEKEDLSSPEEAGMPLLDRVLPALPTQILVMPQDTAPSLQGTEESLLDQTPFQENEGSLLDPELSVFTNQSPLPPVGQNSSLPESKRSLLDQAPYSGQECLSDQNLLSLQDPLSSSLETKPPDVQCEIPGLPDVTGSVRSQVPPSLHQADGTLSSWNHRCNRTHMASLPAQPISPLPVEEPFTPSPWHEPEKPVTQQGREILGQEKEGSLPDTILSLTDPLPSLPDQVVSLPDAAMSALEESPVALQGQMPPPPEPQVSPMPEADVFLPSQIAPPVDDPHDGPIALLDQLPPVLRDMDSTSLMGRTPTSSLQEGDGALPGEIQTLLPSHASPDLPREEGSLPVQAPPRSDDPAAASVPEQTLSSQEGQNASDPPEGNSAWAEQISSPGKAQSPMWRDVPVGPSPLPLPCQEAPQLLPGKSKAVENQDANGSGTCSLASAGAGEAAEILGNLPPEKPPLLKEAKGSGNVSAGDPPSQAGRTTSNQAPNDSGTWPSANTACSRQPQTALPRQGEDQEPEKGKRKSCQCCMLM